MKIISFKLDFLIFFDYKDKGCRFFQPYSDCNIQKTPNFFIKLIFAEHLYSLSLFNDLKKY